jgi:hypothetical protein
MRSPPFRYVILSTKGAACPPTCIAFVTDVTHLPWSCGTTQEGLTIKRTNGVR